MFIKHPVWSLESQDYKQLTGTLDLQNAFNIFMVCQVYFLWSEKKIFGKKVAKNL